MKKTLIILTSSFIFILTLYSCKKTIPNNSNLTGQWQWSYSTGGIGGGKVVPEWNRILILTFNGDSTYSVMDQGTIPLKGIYHITSDTTFGKIIHFNPAYPDPNGELYTIKNNQLILTDYMISDGYTSYYQRIK